MPVLVALFFFILLRANPVPVSIPPPDAPLPAEGHHICTRLFKINVMMSPQKSRCDWHRAEGTPQGLGRLIDHSMTEVKIAEQAGAKWKLFSLDEFIQEVRIDASLAAQVRGAVFP